MTDVGTGNVFPDAAKLYDYAQRWDFMADSLGRLGERAGWTDVDVTGKGYTAYLEASAAVNRNANQVVDGIRAFTTLIRNYADQMKQAEKAAKISELLFALGPLMELLTLPLMGGIGALLQALEKIGSVVRAILVTVGSDLVFNWGVNIAVEQGINAAFGINAPPGALTLILSGVGSATGLLVGGGMYHFGRRGGLTGGNRDGAGDGAGNNVTDAGTGGTGGAGGTGGTGGLPPKQPTPSPSVDLGSGSGPTIARKAPGDENTGRGSGAGNTRDGSESAPTNTESPPAGSSATAGGTRAEGTPPPASPRLDETATPQPERQPPAVDATTTGNTGRAGPVKSASESLGGAENGLPPVRSQSPPPAETTKSGSSNRFNHDPLPAPLRPGYTAPHADAEPPAQPASQGAPPPKKAASADYPYADPQYREAAGAAAIQRRDNPHPEPAQPVSSKPPARPTPAADAAQTDPTIREKRLAYYQARFANSQPETPQPDPHHPARPTPAKAAHADPAIREQRMADYERRFANLQPETPPQTGGKTTPPGLPTPDLKPVARSAEESGLYGGTFRLGDGKPMPGESLLQKPAQPERVQHFYGDGRNTSNDKVVTGEPLPQKPAQPERVQHFYGDGRNTSNDKVVTGEPLPQKPAQPERVQHFYGDGRNTSNDKVVTGEPLPQKPAQPERVQHFYGDGRNTSDGKVVTGEPLPEGGGGYAGPRGFGKNPATIDNFPDDITGEPTAATSTHPRGFGSNLATIRNFPDDITGEPTAATSTHPRGFGSNPATIRNFPDDITGEPTAATSTHPRGFGSNPATIRKFPDDITGEPTAATSTHPRGFGSNPATIRNFPDDITGEPTSTHPRGFGSNPATIRNFPDDITGSKTGGPVGRAGAAPGGSHSGPAKPSGGESSPGPRRTPGSSGTEAQPGTSPTKPGKTAVGADNNPVTDPRGRSAEGTGTGNGPATNDNGGTTSGSSSGNSGGRVENRGTSSNTMTVTRDEAQPAKPSGSTTSPQPVNSKPPAQSPSRGAPAPKKAASADYPYADPKYRETAHAAAAQRRDSPQPDAVQPGDGPATNDNGGTTSGSSSGNSGGRVENRGTSSNNMTVTRDEVQPAETSGSETSAQPMNSTPAPDPSAVPDTPRVQAPEPPRERPMGEAHPQSETVVSGSESQTRVDPSPRADSPTRGGEHDQPMRETEPGSLPAPPSSVDVQVRFLRLPEHPSVDVVPGLSSLPKNSTPFLPSLPPPAEKWAPLHRPDYLAGFGSGTSPQVDREHFTKHIPERELVQPKAQPGGWNDPGAVAKAMDAARDGHHSAVADGVDASGRVPRPARAQTVADPVAPAADSGLPGSEPRNWRPGAADVAMDQLAKLDSELQRSMGEPRLPTGGGHADWMATKTATPGPREILDSIRADKGSGDAGDQPPAQVKQLPNDQLVRARDWMHAPRNSADHHDDASWIRTREQLDTEWQQRVDEGKLSPRDTSAAGQSKPVPGDAEIATLKQDAEAARSRSDKLRDTADQFRDAQTHYERAARDRLLRPNVEPSEPDPTWARDAQQLSEQLDEAKVDLPPNAIGADRDVSRAKRNIAALGEQLATGKVDDEIARETRSERATGSAPSSVATPGPYAQQLIDWRRTGLSGLAPARPAPSSGERATPSTAHEVPGSEPVPPTAQVTPPPVDPDTILNDISAAVSTLQAARSTGDGDTHQRAWDALPPFVKYGSKYGPAEVEQAQRWAATSEDRVRAAEFGVARDAAENEAKRADGAASRAENDYRQAVREKADADRAARQSSPVVAPAMPETRAEPVRHVFDREIEGAFRAGVAGDTAALASHLTAARKIRRDNPDAGWWEHVDHVIGAQLQAAASGAIPERRARMIVAALLDC